MKHLVSLLLMCIALCSAAQNTIQYCGPYGFVTQNLTGVVTITCPTATASATAFPAGPTTSLPLYRNIDPNYTGNINPILDQPFMYVVVGNDIEGYVDHDMVLPTIGSRHFGGLHVGHTTYAGTNGNTFTISAQDSVLFDELWIVEGAELTIDADVYVKKECHNAGTINITSEGSLTFLVDTALHQCATLENIGQINGEITYEAIFFSRPQIDSPNQWFGALPQSLQDSLQPYINSMTYAEIMEFFADNLYLENTNGLAPITLTGYHIKGSPLRDVVYNPFSNDTQFKYRYKGFAGNAGRQAYVGQMENILKSFPIDQGVQIVAYVDSLGNVVSPYNPDATPVLYDVTAQSAVDFALDTSLYNDGIFYNLSAFIDAQAIEDDQSFFNDQPSLSWVPYNSDHPYLNKGWKYVGFPNFIPHVMYFSDLKLSGTNGIPMWENPNHLMASDSIGANVFGLVPGEPMPVFPDDLLPYYPDQVQGLYTTEYNFNSPNTMGKYGGVFPIDAETPWTAPNIMMWEMWPWSELTPVVQEFVGNTWSENNESIDIPLPGNAWLSYIYNANGDLFEYDEYNQCLVTDDSLYCFTNTGITEMYDLSTFSGTFINNNGIVTSAPNNGPESNRWAAFTNPFNGYLNLDLVASEYFTDNPEVNSLEFAFRTATGVPYTSTAINPAAVPTARASQYRRYYRYDDVVYNSEYSFWIQLLIEFAQDNPGVQNDLLAAFVNDWNDNNIFDSGIISNYLSQSVLTPFSYVEVGPYLMPGGALYVAGSGSQASELTMTSDMVEYDFDFPQTVNPYEISGDFTFGNGRAAAVDSAYNTVVMTVDFINDTSFLPHPFFIHQWGENYTNGIQQDEDTQVLNSNWPFLANDSTLVLASTFAREYLPHNADPMLAIVPEPENAAWAIIPVQFQENTSSYISDPPFKRIGFNVVDADSVYGFKYLQEYDTLWFRENDYTYPLSLEIVFTNLIGDVTGDGIVGAGDLLDFVPHYGNCATDVPVDPELQTFDLNGDGCVTFQDQIMLLTYYNYTLDVNGGFNPVQLGEIDITPEVVESVYSDDLRTDPAVTIGPNQEIRIAGHDIYLYDTNLQRVAVSRNEVVAPLQDLYIVFTDNPAGTDLIGHVDFRLP